MSRHYLLSRKVVSCVNDRAHLSLTVPVPGGGATQVKITRCLGSLLVWVIALCMEGGGGGGGRGGEGREGGEGKSSHKIESLWYNDN